MISEDALAELRQELEFARNEAHKAEHDLEVVERFIGELKASLTEVRGERDEADRRLNELDDELAQAEVERDDNGKDLDETGAELLEEREKGAEKDRRIEELKHGIEDAMDELKRVV